MKVGVVLRGEADSASIFPNTTDIGISRERIYAEFLKSHLPSGCKVLFGGFVFNLEGNMSNQIDLIIIGDSNPQFNFHNQEGYGKSFACIEGTLAVVSIKSDLTSSELNDALENIASLPDKEPLGSKANPFMNIPDYEDWPYKVIYSPKGMTMENLIGKIDDFCKANPNLSVTKMPNLIHVGGRGCVIRTNPMGAKTRGEDDIPPNTFYGQYDTTDVYGLSQAVIRIQEHALAAKHILFSYGQMIDKIPFD